MREDARLLEPSASGHEPFRQLTNPRLQPRRADAAPAGGRMDKTPIEADSASTGTRRLDRDALGNRTAICFLENTIYASVLR